MQTVARLTQRGSIVQPVTNVAAATRAAASHVAAFRALAPTRAADATVAHCARACRAATTSLAALEQARQANHLEARDARGTRTGSRDAQAAAGYGRARTSCAQVERRHARGAYQPRVADCTGWVRARLAGAGAHEPVPINAAAALAIRAAYATLRVHHGRGTTHVSATIVGCTIIVEDARAAGDLLGLAHTIGRYVVDGRRHAPSTGAHRTASTAVTSDTDCATPCRQTHRVQALRTSNARSAIANPRDAASSGHVIEAGRRTRSTRPSRITAAAIGTRSCAAAHRVDTFRVKACGTCCAAATISNLWEASTGVQIIE